MVRLNEPNYGETPMTVVFINPTTGDTIPPLSGTPVGGAKNINYGGTPHLVVIVDPATGLPVTF